MTPIAYGLGLGFDPPVLSTELPRTAASERLETGMVLAVTTYVWQQGIGALFQRDAVLVDDRLPVMDSLRRDLLGDGRAHRLTSASGQSAKLRCEIHS